MIELQTPKIDYRHSKRQILLTCQLKKYVLKRILIIGAGKSATVLIDYLNKVCNERNWVLIVADANLEQAQQKIGNAFNAKAVTLNVLDEDERKLLIQEADIVISMLPPSLHILVAKDCVAIGKNLLTASYIDEAIELLREEIKAKELFFLYEMGLDPGIDHMSAVQLIERIKADGGKITSFKSHCGGLVAPESDTNPWHYKISWNPRNIVMAGSAGAAYKKENKIVQKKYAQVFENCPQLKISELPNLAWYPNRDSLSYISLYQLQEAETFIRTTLRYAPFCKGWNVIVDLDLTNENDADEIAQHKSFHDWFAAKIKKIEGRDMSLIMYLELYVAENAHNEIIEQFQFLELLSNEQLPTTVKSSADILQYRIEKKLELLPSDKDLIVMVHEIEYVSAAGKHENIYSSLVVKGEDSLRTAMAKTVGLPLGIAAKLILEEKIKLKGLHIPIHKEIYEQVLEELEQYEVKFNETKK